MRLLSCLTLVAMSISVAHAGSLDGRWDATINIKGTSIPFRLDLTGKKGPTGEPIQRRIEGSRDLGCRGR